MHRIHLNYQINRLFKFLLKEMLKIHKCIPSIRFFTVQTAFGLPGNSDTAISDTSSPCRNTRNDDLGPLPHNKYSCGVSSFAKSAT